MACEIRNPDWPWAVFLMGPTASGKTDLAIALRERFPLDIISVDSAMIYRGLDIGTAKPEPELLARVPHRLVDIRDPAQPYSVGDFYEDALREMRAITQAGRIPLLVGGTMMYFKALRDGLAADLPPANAELRARLEAQWHEQGPEALHRRLQSLDAVAARRIHPHNRQRLLRALEVYEATGRPISSFWTDEEATAGSQTDGSEMAGQPGAGDYTSASGCAAGAQQAFAGVPYNIVNLAVSPVQRQSLHDRIERRFRQMLAQGFVEEVRGLRARGDLDPSLPAIRSVGYRQVWDHLDGKLSYDDMVASGIAATRQLAKRQFTWLRRWPSLTWLDTEDRTLLEKASQLVSSCLTAGKALDP